MPYFDLDPLLESMLDAAPNISDLNLSVGRPPQVEVDGALRTVSFAGLERLMPYQTELVAMRLLQGKRDLAEKICTALKVQTTVEEELFYPAFLEATQEEDLHHEAAIEHDGAKKLIVDIEASGPDDEYFDARVSVLSEMIKHHVHEEEMKDGMFAKARQSDMDLPALGEQMASRKAELMNRMAGRGARSERRSAGAALGSRE